jgi:hypothetical protein
MVEIIVKKTIELSSEEKKGLIDLFNFIFDKTRTIVDFNNQYLNNSKGYSYHVCLIDNGEIVGSLSSIPSDYIITGVKRVCVINVDAMILKKYRDFFYYYDMYMAIDEFAIKDGAVLSYSFPNDDSNPLVLKAKIQYTIGKLNTYCLPYRIGGIKKRLKIFNVFTITFSWIWIYLMAIFSSKKESSFLIEKDFESFNESRYKRMDANYSVVCENKLWFAYKLINYEGIKTIFLIDVAKKSSNNFNKAIRYIVKKHHSEFDILLYVGHLPFGRTGLIKVPSKYEPKNFNFAAKIFDNSKLEKSDIFNINNWDVNLSNTDLI